MTQEDQSELARVREDLAIRFKRMFHHCGTCAEEPPAAESIWFSMAAECIRQMEWARTECVGEHWEGDSRDGTRHMVDRSERPLTPAPEDWKP